MTTATDDPHDTADRRRSLLSALMDGDGATADEACALWRRDAQVRADWHAYHLIGDVMRSDEHHCDAARDVRLLQRLRRQMAAEPVVLAPAPMPSPEPAVRRRHFRAWMAPAAVAAGFAAVAGALVVTQVSAPDGAAAARGGVVAGTAAPVVGARPVSLAGATVPAEQSGARDGKGPMIRSAELDRYLAAHREYANGAMQVAPGGGLRNAAVVAPGR